MSWLYSQVLVEEYLGGISLDGAPCALWNGTHTQQASWLPVKMTDACRLSRSGMTFKPLTDDLGEGVLMSFLEAFPARTSAQPEKVQGSKENEAVCGDTWRESSVKFDPDTSSWKTHQCLWEEDLQPSSLTLPKWGMMLDGVLWERITLPLLTSGTESGFWPTPTANEDAAGTPDGKMQWMLTQAIKSGCQTRQQYLAKKDGNVQNAESEFLTDVPITTENGNASTAKNGHIHFTTTLKTDASIVDQTISTNRSIVVGGQPNPQWIEWLMGWPIDWTDCAASATDKFQQWCNSHGIL